ncbi:hypothetical protein GQ598_10860 [Gilliamella sp. Pas-s95]|nr:hypothetical protein [Gilliamella sp. Pas-s95]
MRRSHNRAAPAAGDAESVDGGGARVKLNKEGHVMEIEQKLTLSENPIHFLKEGLFLKAYNQSFYVMSQLLGFNLKPIIKHIKKLDQIVVCGGFPANVINKRYPNVFLGWWIE